MGKILENTEKPRIDEKDIEIIKILEEDGRMPIFRLAKKVKLSHETVRYRLNKMVKAGMIEKFIVRINKQKIGYKIYSVIMIATWNYTEEEWAEFLNYLLNHDNIVSVEKITGNFDLKISFWSRDMEEFDSISHSIKTKFSKIIKEWQSYMFTKQYKWKELPF